jgi:hypothetical protein
VDAQQLKELGVRVDLGAGRPTANTQMPR